MNDTVQITYDTAAIVEPGQVIKSVRGRAVYRVVEARKVRSKYAGRWKLQCLRITDAEIADGEWVMPLVWYSRKRKPR